MLFPLDQLKDVLRWYAEAFKDPMVLDPPEWFRSFILCEALFQMPFFPVAAYAFLKGQVTTLNVHVSDVLFTNPSVHPR